MILIESRKENNIMGIAVKPTGKFQSIMKRMENQLEAEQKAHRLGKAKKAYKEGFQANACP